MQVRIKEGTERDSSPRKEQGVSAGEAERVELDGRTKFFQLRTTWSRWIIAWISALILFNMALAVFIGSGVLDFRDYQWFIAAVTVETFLQIVALGAIAVKYLFSD